MLQNLDFPVWRNVIFLYIMMCILWDVFTAFIHSSIGRCFMLIIVIYSIVNLFSFWQKKTKKKQRRLFKKSWARANKNRGDNKTAVTTRLLYLKLQQRSLFVWKYLHWVIVFLHWPCFVTSNFHCDMWSTRQHTNDL